MTRPGTLTLPLPLWAWAAKRTKVGGRGPAARWFGLASTAPTSSTTPSFKEEITASLVVYPDTNGAFPRFVHFAPKLQQRLTHEGPRAAKRSNAQRPWPTFPRLPSHVFPLDPRPCALGITRALPRHAGGQAWHQILVGPDATAPASRPPRAAGRSRRVRFPVASVRSPTISVRHAARNPGMPHAVLTAAAPADLAACLPPPPAAAKPRGNPNRGLAPRTIHGNCGAEPRALKHFRRTLLRITRVDIALDRYQARLPPSFAARLCGYPAVLMPTLCPGDGITAAEDRAMRHAVAAPLARWRAAVAEARRAARSARIAAWSTERAARAPAADGQTRAAHTNASSGPPAPPAVSIAPYSGDSDPERELAAHRAGLRAPANRPPRGAPTPGPTTLFKPSRTDPLNREPTATPDSTVPFKPSRTDPLNREPDAFPDPRQVHRIHEPAHRRESKRCAAHAEPAPQARNFCRR